MSPSHELFANDDDDQEDSERDVVFESQEKAEDEAQKAVRDQRSWSSNVCRGGGT